MAYAINCILPEFSFVIQSPPCHLCFICFFFFIQSPWNYETIFSAADAVEILMQSIMTVWKRVMMAIISIILYIYIYKFQGENRLTRRFPLNKRHLFSPPSTFCVGDLSFPFILRMTPWRRSSSLSYALPSFLLSIIHFNNDRSTQDFWTTLFLATSCSNRSSSLSGRACFSPLRVLMKFQMRCSQTLTPRFKYE